MASKIMGKVDYFSRSSSFPANIVDVVINYYISEFDLGDSSGQIVLRVSANQSEQQFINETKNQLADHVNALYSTSFNIADVMGCSL